MAKRLVLLDFRLTGMVSDSVGEVMQVSVRTPIREAFDKLAKRAKALGGIEDLLICCHGFMPYTDGFRTNVVPVGGFGLELCEESLTPMNVGVTAVLKGPPPLVKRIVVFSCAAAQTAAGSKGKLGDGMRFMGEIALTTGARVVASTSSQLFHQIPSIAQMLFNSGARNDWTIDFGEWEGDVFEFSPDDGTSRKLHRAEQPTFDF